MKLRQKVKILISVPPNKVVGPEFFSPKINKRTGSHSKSKKVISVSKSILGGPIMIAIIKSTLVTFNGLEFDSYL